MRDSLLVAALVGALGLGGCTTEGISAADFRIAGVVTTRLAADSITCTVSWHSEVNDPQRPYIAEVAFSGDTGQPPDTGTVIASDSLFSTGSASFEGDFHKPNFLIGWHFQWDTLSSTDSAHVSNCRVN
jgi:hypothetical protein